MRVLGRWLSVLLCVIPLVFGACSNDGADGADGANGEDGANGTNGESGDDGAAGLSALLDTSQEAAGDNCEFGGQRFDTGLDADSDGSLGADEITSTTYVCNGAPAGTPDVSILSDTSEEPAGDNCEFGGDRIDIGLDADDDDELDEDEIESTHYICDGIERLVEVVDEPAGEDCEFGGQAVSFGPDTNGNGTLDDSEVESTSYVCDETEPFVEVDQTAATDTCVACHEMSTPGIVARWMVSNHYDEAVGCAECHNAADDDVDAMIHNGATIATIVSPTDCAVCHPDESTEFQASHHAEGGQILNSLDNRLAEVIEGDLSFDGESPVAVQGCAYCHGSDVQVNDDGTLTANTYPNSGIGRINPDGSWGACSACHMRHDFSSAQARRPENCGRCHVGPDHPQIEIYNESQHGILFYANVDDMALDSDSWVVGEDYSAAPTCTTCHMGATPTQALTHDVGQRLSWVLRSPISGHTDDWEAKRDRMQNVCGACHSEGHVDNFYEQLDAGVDLYNNKFATPATSIYNLARVLISPDTFDDPIEWAYWYLWHHEGRRARSGLAMIGPDYVQWHGFYDIAERFYFELIPDAEEIALEALNDGNVDNDDAADAILDEMETVLDRTEHQWFGWERPTTD